MVPEEMVVFWDLQCFQMCPCASELFLVWIGWGAQLYKLIKPAKTNEGKI